MRIGHEVVGIEPATKEVEVREVGRGRSYREAYDKLVLCPGAEPIRPPIPGAFDGELGVVTSQDLPQPALDRPSSQPRCPRQRKGAIRP